MAGSNRDEKGSIQADISQDVIDAALKSVERHAQPPSEDEGLSEGLRTLEVDMPEGGLTLEVDVPSSVFGGRVRGRGRVGRQRAPGRAA